MAQDLFLLNRSDVRTIRDIIDEQRKQTANPRLRHGPTFDDHPAPDIYLAFVPPPGINPPLSIAPTAAYGDNAVPYTKQDAFFSTATCQIYQLLSTGEAQAISNLTYTVYSTTGVPPNSWVIVGRSKSGDWWVINTPPDLEWIMPNTSIPSLVFLGRQITGVATVAGSGSLTALSANFTAQDVGAYLNGFGANLGRSLQSILGATLKAGSALLTAPSPTFNNDDVGSLVAGPGLPANTTITKVISNTQASMSQVATTTHVNVIVIFGYYPTIASVESSTQATMNVAATSTDAGSAFTVAPSVITAYGASIMLWQGANPPPTINTVPGTFSPNLLSAWLLEVNGRLPKQEIYQCRRLDIDASGVPIYGTRFYEPPYCPTLIGPFVKDLSCVNGSLCVSTAFICVPDGNICNSYVTYCDGTFLPDGSPTCCPGSSVVPVGGTPPCLPSNQPPPSQPPILAGDLSFFGSDW